MKKGTIARLQNDYSPFKQHINQVQEINQAKLRTYYKGYAIAVISIAEKPAQLKQPRKGKEAMKTLIYMNIEEGNAQNVQAIATSKEDAGIYIEASTLQEATALLLKGNELAKEATNNWTPSQDPEEEHPIAHVVTHERIESVLDEYRATDRGRRLIASVERAAVFRYKKEKGGLNCFDANYLMALTYKDIWNGLVNTYNVAYRRGYNKAKNERKSKK